MKRIVLLISVPLLLASCHSDNTRNEAEALLTEANAHFEQGRLKEALLTIDSLRHVYPNAIDTRKKALRLYQDIQLKEAQQELAEADSLLQLVQHDLDYQQEKVDRDKAALRATPEELTMLTRTRMRRDSLRTQCEVLGGKIRYIHKKQKEVK